MKYLTNAWDISEELANVLVHNKYLMDDVEVLKCALYARITTAMGAAYQEGSEKEHIVYNDLSHLTLNVVQGEN